MEFQILKQNPEYNDKRYKYNKQILDRLGRYIETHKDMRFEQILFALGVLNPKNTELIQDMFYEEPWDTYNRIIGA